MSNLNQNIQEAKAQLDAHAVEIVKWHFSPETGCPFWLEWAKESGWNPAEDITCFDDIISKFAHFEDEWLRDKQPEVWVPQEFKEQPFNIFETGGTTGMPKQRIGCPPRSASRLAVRRLRIAWKNYGARLTSPTLAY